jgi:hypothetical protein
MPTTTQRGYGAQHQAERKRWSPLVDAGLVICWRCNTLIQPGTHWDLGHDDHDRTRYQGPEHRRCNRSAAATQGNKQRGRYRPQPPTVTDLTW